MLFKVFGRVSPALLGKIAEFKPLLIHAHFGTDGVLAQTFSMALSLPLIVTFHGFDATTKDEFANRSFYSHRKYIRRREHLIKGCTKFIAVSEFIKGKLLEQGFPEEKIVVHYIGVDINKFQPSPKVIRRPIILFVGRLVEKKGCTFLIRAMQDVQKHIPEAELVVIGDGPLRKRLQYEAERSLRKFQFLGVQPHNVVKEWMDRAKIFSVPSITAECGDAEGFGLVFAEAQAMGVPVVSFQSGGISEAVSNGETGFLLPEKDWEGLAEYITLLFSDKVLWERMSKAGPERVRDKFNLEKQTGILEGLYKECLI